MVGISRLCMKTEKLTDAAGLLTFTCQNSATSRETQMRAEELLTELKIKLDDRSLANAQVAGATLTLEAAIQASLQSTQIELSARSEA